MQKIINAHCHIYPEVIAQRAVQGISDFYGIEIGLNGQTDDLIKDGSEFGVVHYLVHSVATKPAQVRSINEFIASEVRDHPGLFTGFGTLHPDSETLEDDFRHLVDLGLKGVKIHPDFQLFSLTEERALRLGQIVREAGLPVLTHCGDFRYKLSNPGQLKVFLENLPGLTVIGAHLGGWSVWNEVEEKIAGRYDMYVDCSSCFRFMDKGDAVRLIRKFGADKVLWGTDYPAWDHRSEIELFDKLDLTEEEREKILYANAAKLLGVEG
ncbi:MAG: amidohydrolase family protein [Clostridiales bacterium]|nr:amidohydrolase family protein [Clostridiales bacterium]